MARLSHIAAGVLIAAGTTFGAAKGYAHWRVSTQLEELARLVSPYAELRWGGIRTELSGGVEVTDLTIAPRLIAEDIAVESVRLHTGDPRLLFTGLPRGPADAPERLSLAVRGMRIPLSGGLLDGLAQSDTPKRPDPCGPAGMPGPAMLAALGVPALEIDMGADLAAPKGEGQMQLQLNYATRGVDQMTASLAMGGLDQGLPSLREATVRYAPNAETYARMTDHCARQRGSDRETYLRNLAAESDAAFVERLGMAPGPGLREAIARYLRQPNELKVVLRPDAGLTLTPGAQHSLQYWIEVAGLALYVNGQLVEDLSVVPATTAVAPRTDGRAPERQAGVHRDAKPAVSVEPAGFRERPPADISKYLDHRVRVHTRDGKPPREGRLKDVSAAQADIDQRHSGGHLVAHVRLEQIERLEVYTR